MNTVLKRTAILFGPLVLVILLALVFLDDSPEHNRRDEALGQVVGLVYGVYAAVLGMRWYKASRAK